MDRVRSVCAFLFWLLIPYTAAVVGSRFAPGDWYASLAKPAWNPPSYVFAPVWTVLYGMMGVAAWFVWRERGLFGAKAAFGLFFVQLILNAAWSCIFFGLHEPGFALAELVALWAFIFLTVLAFWRVKPLAAGLLLPYFCWTAFAAVLNYQLWILNR